MLKETGPPTRLETRNQEDHKGNKRYMTEVVTEQLLCSIKKITAPMNTNEAAQTELSVGFEPTLHKGTDVIFIRFDYNRDLNAGARQLVRVQWSHSEKAWYVSNNAHYRRLFGLAAPLTGKAIIAHIHAVNQQAIS